MELREISRAELDAIHRNRAPAPGMCIDINSESWHKDGDRCEECGFGIDDYGDGRGYWSEPLVQLHACGDPGCIVPHPAEHKRPPQ